MEDEGSILRKMRCLTDYYVMHKEIGRWVTQGERLAEDGQVALE